MSDIYDDLRSWGDCGDAAEAYRSHNITSHEQAWDALVASDKHEWLVWLALHAPDVPRERVKEFLDTTIERAIRRALDVYNEPTFVTWAHKWLSGEDRTATSALAAEFTWRQDVVWAAARGAWWAAEINRCAGGMCAAIRAVVALTPRKSKSRLTEIRQQADWWRKQNNPFKE